MPVYCYLIQHAYTKTHTCLHLRQYTQIREHEALFTCDTDGPVEMTGDCTATVSSDIGFHGKQTQTGTQSYKLTSRMSQIEDICKINTCARWGAHFNLRGRTPVGEFDSYIHCRPKCALMTSRLTSSKHRDASCLHRSAGGAAPPQTAHTLTHTRTLTHWALTEYPLMTVIWHFLAMSWWRKVERTIHWGLFGFSAKREKQVGPGFCSSDDKFIQCSITLCH